MSRKPGTATGGPRAADAVAGRHTGDRPWLEVRGLVKSFAGVHALKGVDFDMSRGHVHGLVGANGAGKSTLVRCLAGLVSPDAGRIIVDGEEIVLNTPAQARALGFGFIHQELNLVPHFDAVQNMLLGLSKSTRLGLIDRRAARRRTQRIAETLGIRFKLDVQVDELSVAERWMVSIGRALIADAKMIAMDEPTASLSESETERLFGVIRELSSAGVAILYVSHRLSEVLDLCDRITVFRDGRVTRDVSRGELDRAGLVREIAGRDLRSESEPPARHNGRSPQTRGAQPVLELRGVGRRPVLRDVSLQLRMGEILGLGGLVGAGRTELARIIAGADRLDQGEIVLEGKRIHLRGVGDAVRHGIALVPEERRSQALLLNHSVAFNLNVADLRSLRVLPWLPLVDRRRARTRARAAAERLQIKLASLSQPVSALSGGNQQKVLIARWLDRDLKVLILDELSRGVDVGARAEIHRIVRALAKDGAAVIAISSEIEELVELCDRIVVMAEGCVTGEVEGSRMTQQNVISLCYSHAEREMEAVT